MSGFYYELFQNATWFTLGLPFALALPIFIFCYRSVFIRHTARVRTRQLIKAQTKWLKQIAVALLLLIIPVIAFGTFSNEFVRILILLTCYAYTYYAELHWIVRMLVRLLITSRALYFIFS
jgi:hypothetical protein